HLVGGVLITLGLVTRFAAVIQIPILLGAVFFVNLTKGFSPLNSELWLSVLVLMLLILFWIVGSGPYSVDQWLKGSRGR
ncbi:MAG: DoxX family protein, partial [Sphingobacteriia bacterium 35-40-5]